MQKDTTDSFDLKEQAGHLAHLTTSNNKMNTNKIPANVIVQYMEIYKDYLLTNGLDDDSNSITIESLIYFVKNNIQ